MVGEAEIIPTEPELGHASGGSATGHETP
jgi:hypothetical protein